MNTEDVLRFISSYMIAGVIPLDKLLHFIFGMFFTILMLKKKQSLKNVFITLLIIEIAKETYDSSVMTNTLGENICDLLATFIYPMAIWGVRELKKHREKDV